MARNRAQVLSNSGPPETGSTPIGARFVEHFFTRAIPRDARASARSAPSSTADAIH